MTESSSQVDARANHEEPVVLVVDDDSSLRGAVSSLLRSTGLRVETFGSVAEFLDANLPPAAGCLILDIRLPGQSGLDLQAELVREDIRIPIIFISGYGDVPMTVRAMKAGAIDFLTKPFSDQDLLDAVAVALGLDRTRRDERAETIESAGEISVAHEPRAGSHGSRHERSAEQTNRARDGHKRDHREGSSGQCDEKNGGKIAAGIGADGRDAWPASREDNASLDPDGLAHLMSLQRSGAAAGIAYYTYV